MVKPSTKVAIYGATGESGGLIINGLLESEDAQFVSLHFVNESMAADTLLAAVIESNAWLTNWKRTSRPWLESQAISQDTRLSPAVGSRLSP